MNVENEFEDHEPPAERHAKDLAAQQVALDQQRRALKTSYARVFATGNATEGDREAVLNDLTTFGRMFETSVPTPGSHAPAWPIEVLEGRRQVALRIMEFANLPLDVLFHRYWNR